MAYGPAAISTWLSNSNANVPWMRCAGEPIAEPSAPIAQLDRATPSYRTAGAGVSPMFIRSRPPMAARQVKPMGDQGRFGQREPRAVNAGPDSPRLTASETSRKAHDQVASPSDFELSGSR